jgi:prepilin-type N-terminal cleavage/methylation domain-containing protein
MAGSTPRGTECGFTLVELVVSLTIIAVGVFGVMGVMGSSFGIASTATARTRAVALATQEIEALRGRPYAQLQVSDQVQSRTIRAGGTAYTVETATSWKASQSFSQAYKEALVVVSWSDERGVHEVHQTSWFSEPGVADIAAATPTSCGNGPTEPRSLQAVAAAGQEGTAIDVTWQPGAASSVPVARWIIERSSDGFSSSQLLDDAVPADTLTFRSSGLAAATTYGFRIRAVSPCGATSSWSAVVTASKVSLANNGQNAPLASSPQISIAASGTCSGFSVRYQQTSTTAIKSVSMTSSTGSLTASIPVTGPWDVKVHSLEVFEGSTSRATLLLTVCSSGGTCK